MELKLAEVVKFPKKRNKKKFFTKADFKEVLVIIVGVAIGDLFYDIIKLSTHLFWGHS